MSIAVNMWCFIFYVVALTIPTLSVGEPDDAACFSNSKLVGSGDATIRCFEKNVQFGWNRKCKLHKAFKEYLDVVSATCNKTLDENVQDTDHPYVELTKFALTHDLLSDFMNGDAGLKCVNAVKTTTIKCVLTNMADQIPQNSTRVMSMWQNSHYTANHHARESAKLIRRCIVDTINGNKECFGNMAKFVESLYDFLIQYYPIDDVIEEKAASQNEVSNGKSDKIVIALLVIVLIALLYVLFRDWWYNRIPCCMSRSYIVRTESRPMETINQRH